MSYVFSGSPSTLITPASPAPSGSTTITSLDASTGNLLLRGVATLLFALEESANEFVGSDGYRLTEYEALMRQMQPALQLIRYGRNTTLVSNVDPSYINDSEWDNTREQDIGTFKVLGIMWSGNAGGPSTPPDADKSYPAQSPYTNQQVLANIKAYWAQRQTRSHVILKDYSGEIQQWSGYNSGSDYQPVTAALNEQDPLRLINDDMTGADAATTLGTLQSWLRTSTLPILCGEIVLGNPTPLILPSGRRCIDAISSLRAIFDNLDQAWNSGSRFVYGISLTPNQELNSTQNPLSSASSNGNSTAIPCPPTRQATRRAYWYCASRNCKFFSTLWAPVQRTPWTNAPDETAPGNGDAGYPTLETISTLTAGWTTPALTQVSGGSLPDGCYFYCRVQAMSGSTVLATSAEAYMQLAAGSGQSVQVTYSSYSGATGYRVWWFATLTTSTGGPYGDPGNENTYISVAGTTATVTGTGTSGSLSPWIKVASGVNGTITDAALTPLLDNGRIPSLTDLWSYVAEVQNDIYSIRSVILNAARFASLTASTGILAASKTVGGTQYIIAVNFSAPELHAGAGDFAEAALTGATITVGSGTTVARLFEASNPAPSFSGGIITDNFRPMEAHVYTVT